MYLWEIDLTNYCDTLRSIKNPLTNQPYHVSKRPVLIKRFNHYANLAKELAEQLELEAPIVEQTLNLLSLDAKLYYLLVEMIVTTSNYTDEEVLAELERYHKIEYFDMDPGYPFDNYRLIRHM